MRSLKGDWQDLFHTFRIALDLRKLSLGFLGLTLTLLAVVFIFGVSIVTDEIAHPPSLTVTVPPQGEQLVDNLPHLFDPHDEGAYRVVERLRDFYFRNFKGQALHGITERSLLASKARDVVSLAVPPRTFRKWISRVTPQTSIGWWTLGCIGVVTWIIWAYFGGAISRIASVELAKDERIEFTEATQYAAKHYASYVSSPFAVLGGMLFFAFCVAAVAFVCGLVPYLGPLAMAVGLPLALLAGFLMLLLGIGLAVGWPLMIPAISAEGTDGFDAISRSFSYVYGRPWRYLWYHLVALAHSIPSVLFVMASTCLLTKITLRTGGWAMNLAGFAPWAHSFDPFFQVVRTILDPIGFAQGGLSPSTGIFTLVVGFIMGIYLLVLTGYAFAYIPAYLFSAHTTMYFLLRKVVDNTEMKEIYEEDWEEPFSPPAAPAEDQKEEPSSGHAHEHKPDEKPPA
jgi:hypothetical protein